MFGYGAVDVECEREGGEAICTSNDRIFARSDAIEEGLYLEAKRLALRHVNFTQAEARRGMLLVVCSILLAGGAVHGLKHGG